MMKVVTAEFSPLNLLKGPFSAMSENCGIGNHDVTRLRPDKQELLACLRAFYSYMMNFVTLKLNFKNWGETNA